MKPKKFLSIIVSFMLIFTFVFISTADAASGAYTSTSNLCVKYGNYVYYPVGSSIYKINVNTRKKSLVKQNSGYIMYDMTIKDGWIYYSLDIDGYGGSYDPYIYKVRTNGKDCKALKRGINAVIYNDKIYYLKVDNDPYHVNINIKGLYSMSLSGKNDTCIKKSSSIEKFLIYKSNIYYVSSIRDYGYKSSLNKMSLSGKSSKTLVSNSKYDIYALSAYSNYIYFNYGDDIYKIKTTSTTKTKVKSSADLGGLSNGYIYYRKSNTIYKMGLSSKKVYSIVTKSGMSSFDVSSGYIVFTRYTEPSIDDMNNYHQYFCNTSGKNIKLLANYYVS